MNKRIYLSPPSMSQIDKDYLLKAFDSNWIAPKGPFLDDFEKKVSQYLGVGNACAVSSGTAALHLALKILNIGKSDKVLCPSFTFAASANVILYEGAKPIFLDVDPKKWTLDVEVLETAIKKIKPKALIAVDVYGVSCDYDDIIYLCDKYNVFLISDTAEALGSLYKGRKCGSIAPLSVLSFNGNKIITTSGGGMLVSNNEKLVEKSRFLANQARENQIYYEHHELGYNYRLSNLLAALGTAQLTKLDKFILAKRKIFQYYVDNLSYIDGIDFILEGDDCISNCWLTTIKCDLNKIDRDKIIENLSIQNIESRPVWKPMHMQRLYKDFEYISKDNLDISGSLFNSGLCIPSGIDLTIEDQNKIIDIIKLSLY